MIKFEPMTEEEFMAYKAWAIEDYAQEIASNYRRAIEETRSSAAKEIEATLKEDLASPDQFFYNIINETDNQEFRVGRLWIEVNHEKSRCFISYISIYPEYQHRGWGRKALELLETQMKHQGIQRIRLHVFGNNYNAQELYRKMGFEVSGFEMQKWLSE